MLVRFWGTRGSLPTALRGEAVRRKVINAVRMSAGRKFESDAEIERFLDEELAFSARSTYGGASSCVEIEGGDGEFVVCDMGSGLREFGLDSLKRIGEQGRPPVYNLFLSHPHWDHIMGFPFFVPAFRPQSRLRIHGGHEGVEHALRRQQENPSFPVPLSFMQADMEFVRLAEGEPVEVAGLRVTTRRQHHHGDSYGYRFEAGGRSVVYSTDAEHKLESAEATEAFVEFLRDADLVIFDTMYSLADAISVKADWGHSSNIVAVDMCHRAGVGHLVMFHHEPVYDDETIDRVLAETLRYEELMREDRPLKISAAYDGMEIRI